MDERVVRTIFQRIRAGWLPHRLGNSSSGESWWWGRPRWDEGFKLWTQGSVPSMSVVERMTNKEVETWKANFHPRAPELQ